MDATNKNAPPPRSLLQKILIRSWEYRYPRLFWGLRCGGGVVLLALGLLLLSYSSWWGLLLLAGGAGLLGRLPHIPDHPEPACSVTVQRRAGR